MTERIFMTQMKIKKGRLATLKDLARTETAKELKTAILSGRPSRIENAKKIIDEKFKQGATKLLAIIPSEYRDLLNIDIVQKRLFVSHMIVSKAINYFAVTYTDTIQIIDFSPENESYYCRAQIKDTVAAIHFNVEKILLDAGKATVTIATPAGVKIENKMVINFLAKSFIGLFGGTSIGGAILSAKLPPSIKWDGLKARCTFEIPEENTPQWIHDVTAVIAVEYENRGLWLYFDTLATLDHIVHLMIEWFSIQLFTGFSGLPNLDN
jgi:hypothetical protein